jgi:hypothetical protein
VKGMGEVLFVGSSTSTASSCEVSDIDSFFPADDALGLYLTAVFGNDCRAGSCGVCSSSWVEQGRETLVCDCWSPR